MRTILQVPVDKDIRLLAEKAATKMGFSSLQESLRLIMYQMAQNKISLSLSQTEPDEILTPQQEKILMKKVAQSKKEIAKGNYFESDNVDDLMKDLTGYTE